MVVLPVMADINFNQNTFKRKKRYQVKGDEEGFKVVAKFFKKISAAWCSDPRNLPKWCNGVISQNTEYRIPGRITTEIAFGQSKVFFLLHNYIHSKQEDLFYFATVSHFCSPV